MKQTVYLILQIIFLAGLAPLCTGIIKKIKALSQKRKGPPVFQLYFDLAKLFRKEMVISETTSWIFKATPMIYFGSVLMAAGLIPVAVSSHPQSTFGDVIVLVGLLALARFFMVLAGLDAGSTFGGMGSSREMMLAAIFEPALLITLLSLSLASGSTSLNAIANHSFGLGIKVFEPVYILGFLALFIVLITETARIPADDPATHLELTMIHEAMLLEYSGPYLALMEWGAAIKQIILITLLANLFLPLESIFGLVGMGFIPIVAVYIVKVLLITVIIGIFEVNMVKMRLFSLPNLAALAFILALLGFFHHFVLGG